MCNLISGIRQISLNLIGRIAQEAVSHGSSSASQTATDVVVDSKVCLQCMTEI